MFILIGLGPVLATLSGCGGPSASPVSQPQAAEDRSTLFDPATAGAVAGQVTWQGEIPVVPPIDSPINVGSAFPAGKPTLSWQNPQAPVVNPSHRGVGNAVVFLRKVDPRRARPWNLPPVWIEQHAYQIHVRQGDVDAPVGFVERGAEVQMISTQPVFHFLRARGATSFSLTFPDPDRPRVRRLNNNGLVELSSAAGYSWMRGYLFVDEHPYYCKTDGSGRFQLTEVPAGEYDIVCWLPNWHEASHDRDPESGLIMRLFFKQPLEKLARIVVRAGEVSQVSFQVQAGDFAR